MRRLSEVEAWLVAEQAAAGACPGCGAAEPLPVLHGLPDVEALVRLEGRVEFAGCLVPEVVHRWRCGRCGVAWGGGAGYEEGPSVP